MSIAVAKQRIDPGLSSGPQPCEINFRELIPTFLESRRNNGVSEDQTIYKYRQILKDFGDWLETKDHPRDVAFLQGKRGRRYVEDYLGHLRQIGRAPGTVSAAFRCLKTLWRWAVEESLDDDDEPSLPPFVKKAPTDGLTQPKDTPADDVGEPFADVEAEHILAAAGSPKDRHLWRRRDRAVVLVLLNSGVRRKELAGLLVSDYDLATGHITVRRGVAKATRRRDDSRTTAVMGAAKVELDGYVRLLKYHGMGNGPLFPSQQGGKALRPDAVTALMGRLVKRVQDACRDTRNHPPGQGCDRCVRYGGVHRWRATWAINCFRRGVPLQSVVTAGGWSNADLPMRYARKALGEIALKDLQRASAAG